MLLSLLGDVEYDLGDLLRLLLGEVDLLAQFQVPLDPIELKHILSLLSERNIKIAPLIHPVMVTSEAIISVEEAAEVLLLKQAESFHEVRGFICCKQSLYLGHR